MRRQRHAPEASGGWVSTDEEEGNTSSKHVDCFVQFQSAAAAAKIVQGWGGWSMTSDGHNMMRDNSGFCTWYVHTPQVDPENDFYTGFLCANAGGDRAHGSAPRTN